MGGFENITYDDTDPALVYGPGGSWFHGSWNATHTGHSGTLSTSNNPVDNVTFIFPVPAIAFYYYGIKRSRGGLYRICIDCDPNNPIYDSIDAVNLTDDGGNDPIILYSKTFIGDPAIHRVFLQNQPDDRFPGNNSQIDIDRFELEVVDTDSGSSTPTVTTITSLISPSSAPSSATSTPDHSSTHVGAIAGGVVGVLVALLSAFAIWYWCWRKRQRVRPAISLEDDFNPPPRPIPFARSASMTETSTSPSTNELVANKMRYTYRMGMGHRYEPTFTSSDWSIPSTNPTSVRREVDAGPVASQSVQHEEQTLPPEYEEVFQVGRSHLRAVGTKDSMNGL